MVYDIIAARKRLSASEHQQQAVIQETLRRSAVQYYSLVLSQARVSTARQGVLEADELLRINLLRTRTGTGVPADALRAEARLAQRQQDLILAMLDFHSASVDLAYFRDQTVNLRRPISWTQIPISAGRAPKVLFNVIAGAFTALVALYSVVRPRLASSW